MDRRMPVNLSIKNVPGHLAEKLRKRAAKNHRSLQGELMAILEDSVAAEEPLTPMQFLSEIGKYGLNTPEESAVFVKEDRNAH